MLASELLWHSGQVTLPSPASLSLPNFKKRSEANVSQGPIVLVSRVSTHAKGKGAPHASSCRRGPPQLWTLYASLWCLCLPPGGLETSRTGSQLSSFSPTGALCQLQPCPGFAIMPGAHSCPIPPPSHWMTLHCEELTNSHTYSPNNSVPEPPITKGLLCTGCIFIQRMSLEPEASSCGCIYFPWSSQGHQGPRLSPR